MNIAEPGKQRSSRAGKLPLFVAVGTLLALTVVQAFGYAGKKCVRVTESWYNYSHCTNEPNAYCTIMSDTTGTCSLSGEECPTPGQIIHEFWKGTCVARVGGGWECIKSGQPTITIPGECEC